MQGYLTLADLYTFFREVHGLWVAMGEYADLDVYDVLDEVSGPVGRGTPLCTLAYHCILLCNTV